MSNPPHQRPKAGIAWHSRDLIRRLCCDVSFMTMFSTARPGARHLRRGSVHLLPILAGFALAAGAMALVAFLLWPTWGTGGPSGPAQLPVTIGGTLFNVPTAAIRKKIQRRSGPQERIDLSFSFPSLTPPTTPKYVTSEKIGETIQPVDRIFLSIAAHHDSLAPDVRLRTIYPRYLEQGAVPLQDGLTMRVFRKGTPYTGEDLFSADAPSLNARCTRDGETPGMCLSARRIDGADLTFGFPRDWLVRWRDVADAMDRLAVQLHGAN